MATVACADADEASGSVFKLAAPIIYLEKYTPLY